MVPRSHIGAFVSTVNSVITRSLDNSYFVKAKGEAARQDIAKVSVECAEAKETSKGKEGELPLQLATQ